MRMRWVIGLWTAAMIASSTAALAQGQGRQGGDPASKPAQGASGDSSGKPSGPDRLSLSTGETVPAKDAPNTFQRDLLTPPGPIQVQAPAGQGKGDQTAPAASAMASGPVHELSFDDMFRLAHLPKDQRSSEIRKLLGLAPDDALILSEVGDAILDTIAQLKPEAREAPFGLQVEFPGNDQNAKAVAALTFGAAAESRMKAAVDAQVTGIEAFVDIKAREDQIAQAERSLQCELLDASRKKIDNAPIVSGYCVFPHLEVDSAFGRRTYYVQIGAKADGTYRVAGIDPLNPPVPQPAVVVAGERTRLSYQITVEAARGATGGTTATATPDPTSTLTTWSKSLPLLDAAMQVLPPNPGLHLGGVEVPGSGFHWIFALRYFVRPPSIDRRAKYVHDGHGQFRLQCLTPLGTGVAANQHYLKITWVAHADAEDLSLSSRPTHQIPVGFTVGVVPALTPTMYTVGMSLKLHPTVEVFAAAGIRKGLSTRLVYGFTVDMQNVIALVQGKPPGGK